MPTPNTAQVADFIARFRQANPINDPAIDTKPIQIDFFGDSPQMADELLVPILAGIKTATCSSLWQWEHDQETPLEPGHLAAIIDGSGNARCIIQTLKVTITPYNQVDADFAHAEGEGDRTLEYWQRVHWEFFSRTLPRIDKAPAQDMPLLCEHFRVVYQEPQPRTQP